jgi:hypothetical protein
MGASGIGCSALQEDAEKEFPNYTALPVPDIFYAEPVKTLHMKAAGILINSILFMHE